jgi:hypothetical protein
MSKWLTVCIFLLLAVACTVDVEPEDLTGPAAPVALAGPAVPLALAEPAAPTTRPARARDPYAPGEGSLAASEPRTIVARE